MEVLSKISQVREQIKEWKKQGYSIGFVPTMGALHIGHESLIKKAKENCDKVVVSIFVNPIQFGPNEDYNCYPRCLEKDAEICSKHSADLIFAPEVEEMYPEIEHLTIVTPPEFFKDKLCGKTRVGHFDGVATVVVKLFNIIQPDKAFFGLKDAQQLIILKKTCRDLNLAVEIVPCPIIRDNDGLACSSRNAYLSGESREKALSLSKVLRNIEEAYKSGLTSKDDIISESKKLLPSEVKLEYLEVYNFDNFMPVNTLTSNSLVAIAARVDGVRLIDNILIK